MHMRRVPRLLLTAMLVVGLLATGAFAQYGTTSDQTTVSQGTPAVAPGTPVVPVTGAVSCPMGMVTYNPASEVTVTGQVIRGPRQEARGDIDYQMLLRTADGRDVRVYLAPSSFLEDINFHPTMNDTVTVVGIPTTDGIIARQLMWSGQTYALRNPQGAPMWAGATVTDFSTYSSLWNPNQVRTISGRIDRIDYFYPADSAMGPGVAIRVLIAGMEDDMIPSWQQPAYELQPNYVWVHLGPRWYVEQRLPDLRAGQTITVTGSYATWHNQPVILATSVQQGTRIVSFRGPLGRPMWAGGWQNWSQGTMYGVVYPTVAGFSSITGTIESVHNAPVADNLGNSTLLTIRTPDNNLVTVAVAPSWYTQQTGLQFTVGSPITVMGSYSIINGRQILIANQLTYNNQSYILQNVGGVSSWHSAALVCPYSTAVIPPGTVASSGVIASSPGTVSSY